MMVRLSTFSYTIGPGGRVWWAVQTAGQWELSAVRHAGCCGEQGVCARMRMRTKTDSSGGQIWGQTFDLKVLKYSCTVLSVLRCPPSSIIIIIITPLLRLRIFNLFLWAELRLQRLLVLAAHTRNVSQDRRRNCCFSSINLWMRHEATGKHEVWTDTLAGCFRCFLRRRNKVINNI